jgi:hypothetical protein
LPMISMGEFFMFPVSCSVLSTMGQAIHLPTQGILDRNFWI